MGLIIKGPPSQGYHHFPYDSTRGPDDQPSVRKDFVAPFWGDGGVFFHIIRPWRFKSVGFPDW